MAHAQGLKCSDCGKPIIPYQEHHCRTAAAEIDPLAHALLLNMLSNIACMLERKIAPEKVAQQIRDFIARADQ